MNVAAQRACKRCGYPMSSVAEIAPFGGAPGLVALVCTDCGATDSVLIHGRTEVRRSNKKPERSSENPPQYQL
jgi:hypothetical protein